MSTPQPYEIARETVRLLATRKLPPLPENYRAVYIEVAGSRGVTPSAGESAKAAVAAMQPGGSVHELLEPLARLLENTLPALGEDDPRLVEQAERLAQFVRQPAPDLSVAKMMLANYSHRASFAAEDQAEIRQTLVNLLVQVARSLADLYPEDKWINKQVDALVEVSTPPVTLRRLDDAGRRLRDVLFRQTEAHGRTQEAQEQMKRMLALFVDRLSHMTESSGDFHTRIEECARLIGQAGSLEEIAPVLQEAISATRHMALEALQTRDELRAMREKTEAVESQVSELRLELARASSQARHDPLTGALNRKGLDEAIQREIAAARRTDAPLCVALLDIDNFKQLNDRLGHEAGDEALTHLANTARQFTRPQDTLARYGGEEFVIVLPDTVLDAGIEALKRLQRELTRQYFLRNNEKVLITFSAGVAQLAAGESAADAIKRADTAMYLAKRSGKNRVLGC